MRKARRRLALALLALALLAGAAAVAARWRASRLPAAAMPVVFWQTVAAEPDSSAAVAKDAFIDQVSDLWKGGFETPSPRRLRQYSSWGRPLPDAPVLLRIGEARADLVEKDGVEAILAGAGFEAFVDLPCEDVEAGAPGLLSWDDVRAAAKRGTLRFAPCVSARPNAALSLEQAAALFRERTGLRPDALPETAAGDAVAVLGGRHAFALELRQDSTDPAFFGTLVLSHPSGANPPPGGPPLALVVLQRDDPEPLLIEDVAVADADGAPRPIGPDDAFRAKIPAAPRFPLEASVYDSTLAVLYFRRTLYKADVKRDPSWRPPVLAPEERLEIEPL